MAEAIRINTTNLGVNKVLFVGIVRPYEDLEVTHFLAAGTRIDILKAKLKECFLETATTELYSDTDNTIALNIQKSIQDNLEYNTIEEEMSKLGYLVEIQEVAWNIE